MAPSFKDRIRIEEQLDSFMKKALVNQTRSRMKRHYKIINHELPMSDPRAHVGLLPCYDRQEPEIETHFYTKYHSVSVKDEDLAQVMAELKDHKRDIFLLYHLTSARDVEISEELGINLNTVKSTRRRTMQYIKGKLKKED